MAKKNISATIQNENELYKLAKIFLILVVCFGIFYGITYFVTKNQNHTNGDGSSQEKLATIQYDKILVGTLLKQKRDHYYVLLDKVDDQYYNLYESYILAYTQKEDALKVYTIDMNDTFNKSYWSEESNIYTDHISDFKVKEVTLLEIENNHIINSYEGHANVKTKLQELGKEE